MTVQTIDWCTERCLDCGTLPTTVILCVPPSIVLVEPAAAYGTVVGTLTASRDSTCEDVCGPCKYVYTIEYDDAQLAEGYLLVQGHIKDIICDKCLISFVLGNADMGITCADVPACVLVSEEAGNVLEKKADGLFVDGAGAGRGAIREITISDDAEEDDYVILVDATLGAVTVTLPVAASNEGKIYQIKKIDATVNNVVIDGDGADIDESPTVTFSTQYQSYMIICDGTEWWIL